MLLKEAKPRKRFLLILPLLVTLVVENPFALAARVGYSVADINRRSLALMVIGDAILVTAIVLIALWPVWLRVGRARLPPLRDMPGLRLEMVAQPVELDLRKNVFRACRLSAISRLIE